MLLPAIAVGLAVTATCLAFVHAGRSDAYWTGDCANRALVAARLLETGYRSPDFDYPAAALDPAGVAFPLPALGVARGRGRVSVFPLAYPALAAPFLAALGPPGLRWPAALGTGACAALFALWLAPALGRRVALAAAAAFGLATPLFFYGTTVWEHSLTVALVLLASVLLARPGRGVAVAAGVALGLAGWLREELALAGVAWVAVEAWRGRDAGRTLALAGGGVALGAALALFNHAVYASVLGPHAASLDPALAWADASPAELATRIAALVVGRWSSAAVALSLSGVGLTAVAWGGVAEWRGWPAGCVLGPPLLVGVGLAGLGVAHVLSEPPLLAWVAHNGLIPQLPFVCLAGVGWVRLRRLPACASLRPGIAAGLLFLALASGLGLVTQSVFGMGLHVAPRKLLPALPALAALAVVAVCGRPEAPARSRPRAAAAAALLAAGLALSSLAGFLLWHQKLEGAALQDTIRRRPERFVVSGDALLTQALTQLWRDKPLLYAPRAPVLRELVTAMRAHGVKRFLVLALRATPLDDPQLAIRCQRVGRQRGAVVGYWDTDLVACALLRQGNGATGFRRPVPPEGARARPPGSARAVPPRPTSTAARRPRHRPGRGAPRDRGAGTRSRGAPA